MGARVKKVEKLVRKCNKLCSFLQRSSAAKLARSDDDDSETDEKEKETEEVLTATPQEQKVTSVMCAKVFRTALKYFEDKNQDSAFQSELKTQIKSLEDARLQQRTVKHSLHSFFTQSK